MDNRDMSKIKVIGSGSSGNSYILECGEEKLLLELGVDFNEVLKGLDFELLSVVGCLVTHEHLDHAKHIPHAHNHGLPIYSCKSVVDKYPQATLLKLGEKVQIGNFKVQPIEVSHSCQCYAFLIEHSAMGRMLFCTDCQKFPYKIKSLNHVFIEANYDEELVVDNLCKDKEVRSMYHSHMEILRTIEAIRNNYSPSLQTICLMHLSSGNAHPKQFKEMVQGSFGFNNVFVAEKGLEINLQTEEF